MKKISVVSTLTLMFALSTSAVFAGYGTAPNINQAPSCNKEKPAQANFTYVRKTGTNQIEVAWTPTDRATSWTIAYGSESGRYIYGMNDFGDSNSRAVNINMLPTGTYYLVIKANNGCMPGNFSPERKMTVFSNGTVAGARTFRLGSILGRTATPTPSEEVITNITTPTPVAATPTSVVTNVESAPVERLNIFQKIWRFLFGN